MYAGLRKHRDLPSAYLLSTDDPEPRDSYTELNAVGRSIQAAFRGHFEAFWARYQLKDAGK